MQAEDALPRHREHAEGIIRPQVLLGREGKFLEVRETGDIVRMNAGRPEAFAIMRDVRLSVSERPLEPGELQRRDLVTRGDLDRVELVAAGRQIRSASRG